MARPAKKTIYERIEDKENEIAKTQENLTKLNEELSILCSERDEFEMKQLFDLMKKKGLSIHEAMKLFQDLPVK